MATNKNLGQGSVIDNLEILLKSNTASRPIKHLVSNITLHESIGQPTTFGSLQIVDSAGTFETDFTGMMNIHISFEYKKKTVSILYQVDGISDVNLDNIGHEKTYNITLKSPIEILDAQETVEGSYNGSSTDTIKKIWKGYLDRDAIFFDPSQGKNNGKFTAPRLSPLTCIGEILFRSYDKFDNPLFLYETIADRSVQLLSWFAMKVATQKMVLEPIVVKTAAQVAESSEGMPQAIIAKAVHTNTIDKIKYGIAGKTIRTVNLTNTNHKESSESGQGQLNNSILETRYNMDFPEDKQLLGDDQESTKSLSNSIAIRAMAQSVVINNYNCNAVSGLIAGDVVGFKIPIGGKQASKEIVSEKLTGEYVVSTITHMIDCASMAYTQHIQIMKER